MSYKFSYKPLFEYIERRGITMNQLINKNVITDHSANNIRRGDPVKIDMLVNICRYLKVPINQIIEIDLED